MAVARAQLVRQNYGYIPESAYTQRKAFFVAKVCHLTSLQSWHIQHSVQTCHSYKSQVWFRHRYAIWESP